MAKYNKGGRKKKRLLEINLKNQVVRSFAPNGVFKDIAFSEIDNIEKDQNSRRLGTVLFLSFFFLSRCV